MAVTLGSSSGSTPPPGTIQCSGRRDDVTRRTCAREVIKSRQCPGHKSPRPRFNDIFRKKKKEMMYLSVRQVVGQLVSLSMSFWTRSLTNSQEVVPDVQTKTRRSQLIIDNLKHSGRDSTKGFLLFENPVTLSAACGPRSSCTILHHLVVSHPAVFRMCSLDTSWHMLALFFAFAKSLSWLKLLTSNNQALDAFKLVFLFCRFCQYEVTSCQLGTTAFYHLA